MHWARSRGRGLGMARPVFAGVCKARLGRRWGAVELMGMTKVSSGEVTRRAYVARGYAGRPY